MPKEGGLGGCPSPGGWVKSLGPPPPPSREVGKRTMSLMGRQMDRRTAGRTEMAMKAVTAGALGAKWRVHT